MALLDNFLAPLSPVHTCCYNPGHLQPLNLNRAVSRNVANFSCVRSMPKEKGLFVGGMALTLGYICSLAVVIRVTDFGKRHAGLTGQCAQATRSDRGFQLYVTSERNLLRLSLREP